MENEKLTTLMESEGLTSASEAIKTIRKARGPRAVESKIQEEFVKKSSLYKN